MLTNKLYKETQNNSRITLKDNSFDFTYLFSLMTIHTCIKDNNNLFCDTQKRYNIVNHE